MELSVYTFTILVLLNVFWNDVTGEIKPAPDSLPIKVTGELYRNQAPSVYLITCDIDSCQIDTSGDRITAYFSIITPEDKKIDHFEYPVELKFGENKISLKGTVEKIEDDDNEKSTIENKDIPEKHKLVFNYDIDIDDLEISEGEKGTITISIQGVDENGKEVALWSVIADAVAE